jgi:hypothetical protein
MADKLSEKSDFSKEENRGLSISVSPGANAARVVMQPGFNGDWQA